jgi:outer membrane protein OmpA-like peptidoglycan-associated protein
MRAEKSQAKQNILGEEFLLASFFDAPESAPEIKTLEMFFFDKENALLKNQLKKEIEDFTAQVLSYEDYEISYEIFFSFVPSKKLYEKRVDAIRKALIKNGIDKDKIFVKESSDFENVESDYAYIEAQLWR